VTGRVPALPGDYAFERRRVEHEAWPGVFRMPGVVTDVAALGSFTRGSLEASRYVEERTEQLLAEFWVQVLRERLAPEEVSEAVVVSFRRPATWWQHFKEAYGSRWWLWRVVRRWPVVLLDERKTVTVTVDLRRFWTFPAATAPPQLGQSVRWTEWDVQSTVHWTDV
jgi:hypothetical protein